MDVEAYDHTNMELRPAVLIPEYCKQRTPYLIIVHLWDKQGDYLLSRKHDPLKCGRGEGEIDNDECNLSSPSQSKSTRARKPRKKKEEPSPNGIATVVKYFIDFFNESKSPKKKRKVWEKQLIKNMELW